MKKKTDDIVQEWKNKYLRALADYQNLEKRVTEKRSEDVKYAAIHFLTKLLPILDTLEKAEKFLKDQGLSLALKQIYELLKSEQTEKIDVQGKKFDPKTMDCLEVIESDNDGIVLEEILPGYKMLDKVIRPAKVKVGAKKIEQIEEKTNSEQVRDKSIQDKLTA